MNSPLEQSRYTECCMLQEKKMLLLKRKREGERKRVISVQHSLPKKEEGIIENT